MEPFKLDQNEFLKDVRERAKVLSKNARQKPEDAVENIVDFEEEDQEMKDYLAVIRGSAQSTAESATAKTQDVSSDDVDLDFASNLASNRQLDFSKERFKVGLAQRRVQKRRRPQSWAWTATAESRSVQIQEVAGPSETALSVKIHIDDEDDKTEETPEKTRPQNRFSSPVFNDKLMSDLGNILKKKKPTPEKVGQETTRTNRTPPPVQSKKPKETPPSLSPRSPAASPRSKSPDLQPAPPCRSPSPDDVSLVLVTEKDLFGLKSSPVLLRRANEGFVQKFKNMEAEQLQMKNEPENVPSPSSASQLTKESPVLGGTENVVVPVQSNTITVSSGFINEQVKLNIGPKGPVPKPKPKPKLQQSSAMLLKSSAELSQSRIAKEEVKTVQNSKPNWLEELKRKKAKDPPKEKPLDVRKLDSESKPGESKEDLPAWMQKEVKSHQRRVEMSEQVELAAGPDSAIAHTVKKPELDEPQQPSWLKEINLKKQKKDEKKEQGFNIEKMGKTNIRESFDYRSHEELKKTDEKIREEDNTDGIEEHVTSVVELRKKLIKKQVGGPAEDSSKSRDSDKTIGDSDTEPKNLTENALGNAKGKASCFEGKRESEAETKGGQGLLLDKDMKQDDYFSEKTEARIEDEIKEDLDFFLAPHESKQDTCAMVEVKTVMPQTSSTILSKNVVDDREMKVYEEDVRMLDVNKKSLGINNELGTFEKSAKIIQKAQKPSKPFVSENGEIDSVSESKASLLVESELRMETKVRHETENAGKEDTKDGAGECLKDEKASALESSEDNLKEKESLNKVKISQSLHDNDVKKQDKESLPISKSVEKPSFLKYENSRERILPPVPTRPKVLPRPRPKFRDPFQKEHEKLPSRDGSPVPDIARSISPIVDTSLSTQPSAMKNFTKPEKVPSESIKTETPPVEEQFKTDYRRSQQQQQLETTGDTSSQNISGVNSIEKNQEIDGITRDLPKPLRGKLVRVSSFERGALSKPSIESRAQNEADQKEANQNETTDKEADVKDGSMGHVKEELLTGKSTEQEKAALLISNDIENGKDKLSTSKNAGKVEEPFKVNAGESDGLKDTVSFKLKNEKNNDTIEKSIGKEKGAYTQKSVDFESKLEKENLEIGNKDEDTIKKPDIRKETLLEETKGLILNKKRPPPPKPKPKPKVPLKEGQFKDKLNKDEIKLNADELTKKENLRNIEKSKSNESASRQDERPKPTETGVSKVDNVRMRVKDPGRLNQRRPVSMIENVSTVGGNESRERFSATRVGSGTRFAAELEKKQKSCWFRGAFDTSDLKSVDDYDDIPAWKRQLLSRLKTNKNTTSANDKTSSTTDDNPKELSAFRSRTVTSPDILNKKEKAQVLDFKEPIAEDVAEKTERDIEDTNEQKVPAFLREFATGKPSIGRKESRDSDGSPLSPLGKKEINKSNESGIEAWV